jgi:hypothetical protein
MTPSPMSAAGREPGDVPRRRSSKLTAVKARRALAIAAVLLAAPGISACSRGFSEQTDQVYNPAAGVDDRSGTVYVLNALIVSGTNGSGTIVASLVNTDQEQDDTLTGVAGAGADSSAQVKPGGETTIPAGGLLNLATKGQIEITDSRVVPGQLVELRFTFDRGQAVTVRAPVVSAEDPAYDGIAVPG